MHQFCLITAKTHEAADQLLSRLEHYIHRRLTFEPREVVLHQLDHGAVIFSASLGQELLGIETPCYLRTDRACVVGGLPTFERFPEYKPSHNMQPAAWVDELMERFGPEDLHLRLGGAYSVLRALPGNVTGFSAFSGYDSLFYLDTALYTAVGNRPALVAAFQSAGPCSTVNTETLSWILSTTMILGHETPWREVSRVSTGHFFLDQNDTVGTRPFSTTSFTPPEADDLEDFRDAALDGLLARYQWYLDTGTRFQAHLTGGKDSRTNLALLLATDSVDRMEAILTVGTETNGDVIVARRIAESVGLANHVVEPGAKKSVDKADWEDYRDWFRFSPWKYDMYLTPFDGHRRGPGGSPPPVVTLMGGGGEVVRQKEIAPDPRRDGMRAIVDRFTNWYYRFNALGLLSKEILWWQRAFIRKQVTAMVEAGIVNLQQRFYIENRMANWGNAHFRGASNHSLAGLLDINLARLMHIQPDMGDELPFEIMTRVAPSLRDHPFVNDSWSGPTRRRAEAEGVLQPPLAVAAGRNFPWQFALYRQSRDALVQSVLPHVSLWKDLVPQDNLAALIEEPVEPFSSAHVKMLFGLVAATNYLRDDLRPEREFAGMALPLRAGGSFAGRVTRWFAHRRIAPGSDAWAARALVETSSVDMEQRPAVSCADLSTAECGDPDSVRRTPASPAWGLPSVPAGPSPRGYSSSFVEGDREEALRGQLAEVLEEHEQLIRQTEAARADARAIERSRSWRLLRAALRLVAVIRRRPAEPVRRLERLVRS